jgi:anti-sigma factor RsiW
MDHKPFEAWLISDEPLLPEDEQRLHEHIESCESCRQLSTSWAEVQDLFREPQLVQPPAGFTERWQTRLVDFNIIEKERSPQRASWIFFASMAGAALLILGFMAVQFFSSVQAPIQVFIGGMTLIAGVLNLASTLQIAIIPFLEVVLVSVPTYWWLIMVIAACLLTLVLTFSARRILFPRRVSL